MTHKKKQSKISKFFQSVRLTPFWRQCPINCTKHKIYSEVLNWSLLLFAYPCHHDEQRCQPSSAVMTSGVVTTIVLLSLDLQPFPNIFFSVFKASPRRRLDDKASRKLSRPGRLIFFRLTLFFLFFSLFLSFFRHFSSDMTSPRLALPRLRRRLKGKKGVNRHASPYRL
jgi:hypothetical protein